MMSPRNGVGATVTMGAEFTCQGTSRQGNDVEDVKCLLSYA
jgi:hypothetical protein